MSMLRLPRNHGCLYAQWKLSKTHIPARANGLVNSSTRFPASRPSPSTDITTRSSEKILASWRFVVEVAVVLKSSSAKDLRQTMEHSVGVTEMFKNGYRLAQEESCWGVCSGCSAPPFRGLAGKMSLRMGCR